MSRILAAVAALLTFVTPIGAAEPAAPLSALARMPVKEVTVFKDGHAYVVHQGTMPTENGNVLLDLLPTPVLGTFWPYSLEKDATLHSVTAGRRRVKVERTAMTIRELIEGNVGADVLIAEGTKPAYQATIVKLLTRSADELAATLPPATATEHLPMKSNILLLKTVEGTRAVPIEQITDVKFIGKYETKVSDEEIRNLLTMKLAWGDKPAGKTAEVGMAYVQKGIRWIPNYRIELDAKGKAVVKLQATLLNELTDLKDATVNLVVGVPSFYFKETADPIALSQAVAQLSQYFQTDLSTNYAMSNAMMTQVARGGEVRVPKGGGGGAAPNLGPDVGGDGSQSEDLFVFTVKNVTLAKGQRMVLPVTQLNLEYKDVYTLDIPYAPPVELRRQITDARTAELVRLMTAPKVLHKIRLLNGNTQPLTTAPALLLKEGKVLSQGMMTYTSKGGAVDITLTTAVDVKVKKTDKEAKRTPNAASFDGHSFWRIDIDSAVELTNQSGKPIEVEVTRYVLGNVDKASEGAKAEMVNLLEADDVALTQARPDWWGYYSWPTWWGHFNGIGRVTWTAKLEPGKSADITYSWHYYWR